MKEWPAIGFLSADFQNEAGKKYISFTINFCIQLCYTSFADSLSISIDLIKQNTIELKIRKIRTPLDLSFG